MSNPTTNIEYAPVRLRSEFSRETLLLWTYGHWFTWNRISRHVEGNYELCVNKTGVGVFALDTEDKLLLIPGADVVVDIEKHELGLTRLLNAM